MYHSDRLSRRDSERRPARVRLVKSAIPPGVTATSEGMLVAAGTSSESKAVAGRPLGSPRDLTNQRNLGRPIPPRRRTELRRAQPRTQGAARALRCGRGGLLPG
jgi:hypothetical protein